MRTGVLRVQPSTAQAKSGQTTSPAHLDVLEQDVGSEGGVGGGSRNFSRGHIHALEVVPGCAVGLDSFGQGSEEVLHVDAAKGVSPSDGHPEQVHLWKRTSC